MKSIVAILLSLGTFVPAVAQTSTPTATIYLPIDSSTHLVTYDSIVHSTVPGPELFNRAVEWLDTAFRYGSSEIRVADMQAGKIVSRQTVQLIIDRASYNVIFTMVVMISQEGYKYKITNIYYDRIGLGLPIVKCEDLVYATRGMIRNWIGVFAGSISKISDAWLLPMDDLVRREAVSFNHSMTRDTAGDKNTW